jgi:hypothetical protein
VMDIIHKWLLTVFIRYNMLLEEIFTNGWI